MVRKVRPHRRPLRIGGLSVCVPKCCSSSRQSSEEEAPFLGKAVRVDFLEEVRLEEALKNGWTCDSQSKGVGESKICVYGQPPPLTPHQNRSFWWERRELVRGAW